MVTFDHWHSRSGRLTCDIRQSRSQNLKMTITFRINCQLLYKKETMVTTKKTSGPGDIRRLITEYCILPLGQYSLSRNCLFWPKNRALKKVVPFHIFRLWRVEREYTSDKVRSQNWTTSYFLLSYKYVIIHRCEVRFWNQSFLPHSFPLEGSSEFLVHQKRPFHQN